MKRIQFISLFLIAYATTAQGMGDGDIAGIPAPLQVQQEMAQAREALEGLMGGLTISEFTLSTAEPATPAAATTATKQRVRKTHTAIATPGKRVEEVHITRITGTKGLKHLSDRALLELICITPYLETLFLEGREGFTDEYLRVIAAKCRLLKRILIINCPKITADGIMAIVYSCGMLRRLYLSDCQGCNTNQDALTFDIRSNRPTLHFGFYSEKEARGLIRLD